MSTADILAELPNLSTEDLQEVRRRLNQLEGLAVNSFADRSRKARLIKALVGSYTAESENALAELKKACDFGTRSWA
jgi:hypothetical protein